MRTLILCCVFVCLGCAERPRDQVSAPSSPDVATSVSRAPATLPNRWARPVREEPDPAAKGLYRSAMTQVFARHPVEAQALFEQIVRDYPESRFAERLSAKGPSAAAVAVGLGVIGALGLSFGLKHAAD